jgi:hypothetical protein
MAVLLPLVVVEPQLHLTAVVPAVVMVAPHVPFPAPVASLEHD